MTYSTRRLMKALHYNLGRETHYHSRQYVARKQRAHYPKDPKSRRGYRKMFIRNFRLQQALGLKKD